MSQFDSQFETSAAPALESAFGVAVVMHRGSTSSAPFTATWVDQQFETVSEEGFTTKTVRRKFTFARTDAVISGQAVKPREGDQFVLTENGVQATWEVMPPDANTPAVMLEPGGYRYSALAKKVA